MKQNGIIIIIMNCVFNLNERSSPALNRSQSNLYLKIHEKKLMKSKQNYFQNNGQKSQNPVFKKYQTSFNFIDQRYSSINQSPLNSKPKIIQRVSKYESKIQKLKLQLNCLKLQLQGLKQARQQKQLNQLKLQEQIQKDICNISANCLNLIQKKENSIWKLTQIQTIKQQINFMKNNQKRKKIVTQNNLKLFLLQRTAIRTQISQINKKIRTQTEKRMRIEEVKQKLQKIKAIKEDTKEYLQKIYKMNQHKFTKVKNVIAQGIQKEHRYSLLEICQQVNRKIKDIQQTLQVYKKQKNQAKVQEIKQRLIEIKNQCNDYDKIESRIQSLIVQQFRQTFQNGFKTLLIDQLLPKKKVNEVVLQQQTQIKAVQKRQAQLNLKLKMKQGHIVRLLKQQDKTNFQIYFLTQNMKK